MESLWNDNEATTFASDPLATRVYTSRLLGSSDELVLHGGGNTSVKMEVVNDFGEKERILYVKGSGWDLATIEAAGFAPVKLDVLLKMVELDRLSDGDMVRIQRAAMIDPGAPNPSVEAVLHAFIPFQHVDHTHADAVVTITNTPDGDRRIRDLYGENMLVVPYVMPGFILAKKIYDMTRDVNWQTLDGMILMNHGVFTFSNDARESYERMIAIVSQAESYLADNKATVTVTNTAPHVDLTRLARLRRAASDVRGGAMIASLDASAAAVSFSNIKNVSELATRGPLTPDHVLRTKRTAMIVGDDPQKDIDRFRSDYLKYYDKYKGDGMTCLDAAPRWAVWPKSGVVKLGKNAREAGIVGDIVDHTVAAIQKSEKLGAWQALPEKEIFDVEYWELEQAKLKKASAEPELGGKVALVTGGAGGIGKACVGALRKKGAAVAVLDLKADESLANAPDVLSIACDVTNDSDVTRAINTTVQRFGGIDILVNNAGIFPASAAIRDIEASAWEKSIRVNLTAQQLVLSACIPFLELGVDPAVVFVASKNVPAPGPGAAMYSVSKAGVTQLARVAALELAPLGIRVNVVHPNNVFDTGIWTKEVLEARAQNYKMTVDEYKKNSLLGVEVTSHDVANLVCAMAGTTFAKTTGAQVPIDGGNERVI